MRGSGTTLLASRNLHRRAYGFEIDKNFYRDATQMLATYRSTPSMFDMVELEDRRKRGKNQKVNQKSLFDE